MPYQEWIKFGRDPIYPVDFFALSSNQAKAFMVRVLDAIPTRMEQLTTLVREECRDLRWLPDLSDLSFLVAADVLTQNIQTYPRSTETMARDRHDRPEIFNQLEEPVRDFEVTDRTFSIMYDVALYFAICLRNKEPRLEWKLSTGKTMVTRNQPVLRAPIVKGKFPIITCDPFDIFLSHVLNVGEGHKHPYTRSQMYAYWCQDIADYKIINPPFVS